MAPLGDIDPNVRKTDSSSGIEQSGVRGDENNRNKTTDTAKHSTTSSRKRKSDVVEEPQNVPEIDDDDPRLHHVDETCNQIRRKIKNFIEGGNMKVGEFQKAIGVSSASYQRFMNQSGTYTGSESDTYERAFAFFKKRELQGLEAAPPKKPKRSEEKKALDVGDIKLDGEDTEEVPVYDTCDEVRKKIRAFLRKPDVSQAAFCHAIARSFPEEHKIQSRQLNAFLDKKGSMSGNTSRVFYGAYVFFEKLRIKEGKPKSEMRLEMEKIHPRGVNTSDPEKWFICRGNEKPVHDKYGRVHFVRS
ncbi:hypothetical protein F5Y05DRAFT_240846 [Hypoxylon sp. FL0543]|nr:hypothetical protein F5Y05DRAFT_240846 [Hypoxylon sp. FL0543]